MMAAAAEAASGRPVRQQRASGVWSQPSSPPPSLLPSSSSSRRLLLLLFARRPSRSTPAAAVAAPTGCMQTQRSRWRRFIVVASGGPLSCCGRPETHAPAAPAAPPDARTKGLVRLFVCQLRPARAPCPSVCPFGWRAPRAAGARRRPEGHRRPTPPARTDSARPPAPPGLCWCN